MTQNTTMTREEWTRRYAARLVEVSGIEQTRADEFAEIAALQNIEFNGDDFWLDPEDDADVELSYWENDE